jgi:hypothetical protein
MIDKNLLLLSRVNLLYLVGGIGHADLYIKKSLITKSGVLHRCYALGIKIGVDDVNYYLYHLLRGDTP